MGAGRTAGVPGVRRGRACGAHALRGVSDDPRAALSDGADTHPGTRLDARNLALLTALGLTSVHVGARPRVAILSTGDELLEPGAPLREGAVRDSNGLMLAQLVEEAGGEATLLPRLPDDPARVEAGLRAALASHDVVLTIGGVSAGDFDPVKQAIAHITGLELWRVAMRPGRPQAFGALDGRLFFGLPGNPASVVCVFEALVRPTLLAWQGFAAVERARIPVRCAVAIASREGRTDFVRCRLAWHEGRALATPEGAQVSGHLTPQAWAHALLIVPESIASFAAGDAAEAIVWSLP